MEHGVEATSVQLVNHRPAVECRLNTSLWPLTLPRVRLRPLTRPTHRAARVRRASNMNRRNFLPLVAALPALATTMNAADAKPKDTPKDAAKPSTDAKAATTALAAAVFDVVTLALAFPFHVLLLAVFLGCTASCKALPLG
jgi:hypothetical protein